MKKVPDFWRMRRDNYAQFYADRQHFLSLPPEQQDGYRRLAEVTRMPELNMCAGITISDDDRRNLIMLGIAADVDHWYINRFIVTDGGWDEFVRQFNALPDPKSVVVQMGVQNPSTGLWISAELSTGEAENANNSRSK